MSSSYQINVTVIFNIIWVSLVVKNELKMLSTYLNRWRRNKLAAEFPVLQDITRTALPHFT
jgi:hypothetical protein